MATHSCILAGRFHGQRRLAGYIVHAVIESDTTDQLNTAHVQCIFICCNSSKPDLKEWGFSSQRQFEFVSSRCLGAVSTPNTSKLVFGLKFLKSNRSIYLGHRFLIARLWFNILVREHPLITAATKIETNEEFFFPQFTLLLGFPCGSAGKESTCNAGDLGLIPGLGRSLGEGKGYPLQYSGLDNSMDCIVLGGRKELDMTKQLSLIIEHLASWGWGIALCMIPYHSASQIICEPPQTTVFVHISSELVTRKKMEFCLDCYCTIKSLEEFTNTHFLYTSQHVLVTNFVNQSANSTLSSTSLIHPTFGRP